MNALPRPLLLVLFLLLLPLSARAEHPCTCSDLPRLEKELFEQEWLQRWFMNEAENGGGRGDKAIADLQARAQAAFNAWLHSPAGGGGGKGSPDLGTDTNNCKVMWGGKPLEGNEPAYRKSKPGCSAQQDMAIAHEQHHVARCEKWKSEGLTDNWNWVDFFAGEDAAAYGAGIVALRKDIADLAGKCHWEGSTQPDKKGQMGEDEKTVPTPDDVKKILGALRGGRGR